MSLLRVCFLGKKLLEGNTDSLRNDSFTLHQFAVPSVGLLNPRILEQSLDQFLCVSNRNVFYFLQLGQSFPTSVLVKLLVFRMLVELGLAAGLLWESRIDLLQRAPLQKGNRFYCGFPSLNHFHCIFRGLSLKVAFKNFHWNNSDFSNPLLLLLFRDSLRFCSLFPFKWMGKSSSCIHSLFNVVWCYCCLPLRSVLDRWGPSLSFLVVFFNLEKLSGGNGGLPLMGGLYYFDWINGSSFLSCNLQ